MRNQSGRINLNEKETPDTPASSRKTNEMFRKTLLAYIVNSLSVNGNSVFNVENKTNETLISITIPDYGYTLRNKIPQYETIDPTVKILILFRFNLEDIFVSQWCKYLHQ